jgi:hypothetical protein
VCDGGNVDDLLLPIVKGRKLDVPDKLLRQHDPRLSLRVRPPLHHLHQALSAKHSVTYPPLPQYLSTRRPTVLSICLSIHRCQLWT